MKELINKYHNLIIYDYLYRIGFCIHNIISNFYMKKCKRIDPIKDYKNFVNTIERIQKRRFVLGQRFLGCECLYYGHYNILVDYSGYNPQYRTIGMGIVHGVDFSEAEISQGRKNSSFVFFAQGNKTKVKKNDIPLLLMDIGPFIHYAKKIYDEDEEKALKNELGRTVLIYPTHTYEKSTIEGREIERYKKMINRYAESFDTILFCIYWHDVLDETFRKIGELPKVKLVSCGLRSDSNFLARTKSLISLADLVVGTHIGTFLGYAIYMKKRIEYIEMDENIQEFGEMTEEEVRVEIRNKALIKKALLDGESIIDMYIEFWGGEKKLRTKEEIAAVLELRDEIINTSKGYVNRFNIAVQSLKEKYEYSTDSKGQFKYIFLEEQNGEFF